MANIRYLTIILFIWLVDVYGFSLDSSNGIYINILTFFLALTSLTKWLMMYSEWIWEMCVKWILVHVIQFGFVTNRRLFFNSLWLSDAIWPHKSGLILAQVMACCLTAPKWNHNLNQCSLIITKTVLHYHKRFEDSVKQERKLHFGSHPDLPGTDELRGHMRSKYM